MKPRGKRNNQFILLLDDETSDKLRQLASDNDHAPSKQAYIIIRNALECYYLRDEKGNDIVNIGSNH